MVKQHDGHCMWMCLEMRTIILLSLGDGWGVLIKKKKTQIAHVIHLLWSGQFVCNLPRLANIHWGVNASL